MDNEGHHSKERGESCSYLDGGGVRVDREAPSCPARREGTLTRSAMLDTAVPCTCSWGTGRGEGHYGRRERKHRETERDEGGREERGGEREKETVAYDITLFVC